MYVKRSLGVINIAEETRENRFRWLDHVERKNNEDK